MNRIAYTFQQLTHTPRYVLLGFTGVVALAIASAWAFSPKPTDYLIALTICLLMAYGGISATIWFAMRKKELPVLNPPTPAPQLWDVYAVEYHDGEPSPHLVMPGATRAAARHLLRQLAPESPVLHLTQSHRWNQWPSGVRDILIQLGYPIGVFPAAAMCADIKPISVFALTTTH